jgi:hypothetical protein
MISGAVVELSSYTLSLTCKIISKFGSFIAVGLNERGIAARQTTRPQ